MALALSTFLLSGCLHHHTQQPSPADLRSSSAQRGYLDLQPGWKITVIYPKLRSGGYVLPSMQQQAVSANTVDMKASDDFLGCEKDFYQVAVVSAGELDVRFSHAELWQNGQRSKRVQPGLSLFPAVSGRRYVRLVYLTRESEADHDMAIVAAVSPETLDAITQDVIQHARCESRDTAVCTWVPKGVAVDAEK